MPLNALERGMGLIKQVRDGLSEVTAPALAEGCGPVIDGDYEDLALVGDPHSGALKRRPASRHGLVVDKHMHDTPALASEGRKAMDRDTGFAGNLPQPGQLARPVLENHCQVRRHRIFDLSTASGRLSPAGSAL
jgi:hypothetical protein